MNYYEKRKEAATWKEILVERLAVGKHKCKSHLLRVVNFLELQKK